MPVHIDIEGETSIVIARKNLAVPFFLRALGRGSIGGLGPHARLLLLALLAVTFPAGAEED